MIAITRLLRARVNDRLARAARFPVTLIVAPAGFGKSVALRDFLETARLDVVRYDVAREDRTLTAFVHGLAAALAPVAPSALAAFPAMQQRVMGADDPVRELGSWFAEHLKRTVCTIVIDDLHYAATDPAAVALLVDLVERIGDRVRWIVATRSDAGLPIASWIGYGRMDYPVGEDDLRFTTDEALATADDAQAAAEPAEIEALRELTGGWPIALSIALRTRTHAADLRAAASGTREMVYRYLAEQVFAGLDRAQQRFLLRTSAFPTFDDEIAETLGATPEFLAELRRAVAFLATSSPSEYRYHDLFREFLEHELRRSGATAWFETHVEAGALLERRRGGDVTALKLYTKVGAVEPIVRVIENDGIELLERGEGEAVAAALDAVPEARRREHAALTGVRAMLDANRGRFDVAESAFAAAIERAPAAELRVALVHRYAIELVRQNRDCAELLEPYAADETLPLAVRVPMLGTLATAYVLAGRVDDAVATVRRALDLQEPLGDDLRARLYHQAAYVYQFTGARDRVRAHASAAVELASARGLFELAARAYSVLSSAVGDEEDDPIAVLAILDKLQECARKGASRQVRVFGIVESYAIEVERDDEAAIERLDRELRQEDAAPVARAQAALLPADALRAAWDGTFGTAHDLLAGTAEAQPTVERRALRAAETALYAFAAALHDEGEAALREALAALERCKPSPRIVRAQLTLALAELVRGRSSAAHRHLVEAERRLTPAMRRMRAFGNAVRALQRVQLEQADPATLTAALERLRAEHFGGMARLLGALPVAREQSSNYTQLTPSEREILQLLAKGASTKDVAAKTGRSPQTVDTHIRSICRKLNCSGRREAIAIATGAGWVSV
ncbi:MAG TPA: LuxR C-terminal-related transcriptional regulator [Candidatus Elarobacter sp.]|jgi:LuxR family maltose regulon positive regulatory protein|nr:LuxR C-terminal-related transcriptional regulator [Candidatus Elarobacter sp.]